MILCREMPFGIISPVWQVPGNMAYETVSYVSYQRPPLLLGQDKKEVCKSFLDENIGYLNTTDFSLHSIGVILFRYSKEDIFHKFVEDVMPDTKLLSLPMELYRDVVTVRKNLNLDFDDTYQYCVAKYYGLKVVTMDKDFEKIKDLEILFL